MDSNREKNVLNLGKRASILFVMKAVVYIRHSIVKKQFLDGFYRLILLPLRLVGFAFALKKGISTKYAQDSVIHILRGTKTMRIFAAVINIRKYGTAILVKLYRSVQQGLGL